jgi:hypothetical protein
MENTLKTRVDAFLAHVTALMLESYQLGAERSPHVEAEYGAKWIKVWTYSERGPLPKVKTSIYCFIAAQDFSNKTIGTVKTGEIYMAASVQAPAKHARGSVFSDDFSCAGPHGIALRG